MFSVWFPKDDSRLVFLFFSASMNENTEVQLLFLMFRDDDSQNFIDIVVVAVLKTVLWCLSWLINSRCPDTCLSVLEFSYVFSNTDASTNRLFMCSPKPVQVVIGWQAKEIERRIRDS